jgi:hypothetical protein
MIREGIRRRPNPGFHWIEDELPALHKTFRLGIFFDLILLNTVWMHVKPADPSRAFRKVIRLLKPCGALEMTFRQPPVPCKDSRGMHAVGPAEIEKLARDHGAGIVRIASENVTGPTGIIQWTQYLIRLPDGGTGALPLLRHIILNDNKSSIYKWLCSEPCVGSRTVILEWSGRPITTPSKFLMVWCALLNSPVQAVARPQISAITNQRWLSRPGVCQGKLGFADSLLAGSTCYRAFHPASGRAFSVFIERRRPQHHKNAGEFHSLTLGQSDFVRAKIWPFSSGCRSDSGSRIPRFVRQDAGPAPPLERASSIQ